jgi:hypothetical protein
MVRRVDILCLSIHEHTPSFVMCGKMECGYSVNSSTMNIHTHLGFTSARMCGYARGYFMAWILDRDTFCEDSSCGYCSIHVLWIPRESRGYSVGYSCGDGVHSCSDGGGVGGAPWWIVLAYEDESMPTFLPAMVELVAGCARFVGDGGAPDRAGVGATGGGTLCGRIGIGT